MCLCPTAGTLLWPLPDALLTLADPGREDCLFREFIGGVPLKTFVSIPVVVVAYKGVDKGKSSPLTVLEFADGYQKPPA